MNLPKTISFDEGYIENLYFYDGLKYGKREFDNDGNLLNDEKYFGNLILRNGHLFRILHDEGYVNLQDNGLPAELNFHIKDHLGNVRAVLSETADRQPVVVQASGYYPFGMLFQSEQMQTSLAANANPYLYNGKEIQDMPGKWYDYGARFYDAGLGRWHVEDPLAEKYLALSPYSYVANNPLKYIDDNGEKIRLAGSREVRKQTRKDLAKIMATNIGRQIIKRLRVSKSTYVIGNASSVKKTRYKNKWYSINPSINYYQGDAKVEGANTPGFVGLGHELYHAYQDETVGISGKNVQNLEYGAVKFGNYLRETYSTGQLRSTYLGKELFSKGESLSFPTNGNKIDQNSFNTSSEWNNGLGYFERTSSEEGVVKRDNTDVSTSISQFVQTVVTFMLNNDLKTIKFERFKDK